MASNNELLFAACKQDSLEMLEEVLSSDKTSFNINHRDGLGNSALHYATKHGSTGCLEVLMYYDGIKLNIANNIEGNTPLHHAAGYKDPDVALEMVETLVNSGASVKIKNKHQQTPADVAPHDTHADVKKRLEEAALAQLADPRDVVGDDDDASDGIPSDDD
ncbi:MAG: ankyrin repeat-containing domain protein [Benniella sp.]|nr:MAG: ankyrin repeat-containing domain protein [Benniella sp.]